MKANRILLSWTSWLFMAIAFLTIGCRDGKSEEEFVWLEPEDNVEVFQEVQKAFSEELKPEDNGSKGLFNSITRKYISRVGVYEESYLVLIGYRYMDHNPEFWDYFRAFSYDRANKHISDVLPEDHHYFQWSLLAIVSFKPSSVPDVVFRYLDCLECESTELLSSFSYNQKANKWEVRIWPDDDPHLMIGSDAQYGDDTYTYDCLHSISDFNSDGYADIAIRCRETVVESKKVTDEIFLYSIQDGIATKEKIQDKDKILQMNEVLCKGQDSPLCK